MHVKKALIIASIVSVVLLAFAASGLLFRAPTLLAWRARDRLLSESDFEALVKSGREILSEVHVGPNEGHLWGAFPVPSGVRIPKTIRHLRPRGILISYDGFLFIEMHGVHESIGIRIYPADFQEPRPGFVYGDRKLTEGLWYCDSDYSRDAQYARKIDALIAKNKAREQ